MSYQASCWLLSCFSSTFDALCVIQRHGLTASTVCWESDLLPVLPSSGRIPRVHLVKIFRLAFLLLYCQGRSSHLDLAMPRDLWPSFRYRPDGLLFNSFQANRDIYEGNHNVKKGNFYQMYPRKAGGGNTWNCVDKEARHARKRRILNAAFSDKALKTFEGCIVQHVDRWCELIGADNGWSKPRNMADWSDRLVFDILGTSRTRSYFFVDVQRYCS